jgi:hypothetical protein
VRTLKLIDKGHRQTSVLRSRILITAARKNLSRVCQSRRDAVAGLDGAAGGAGGPRRAPPAQRYRGTGDAPGGS